MSDIRFARLKKDPRFQPIPQKVKKVKIDDRFKSMMTDAKFSISGEVDEYGRKNKSTRNKELEEYYYHDETKPQKDEEDEAPFEWNEESSDEENNDEDQNEKDAWNEVITKPVMSENMSDTISIQNIDWTQINAQDIFMLFTSFCTGSEKILQVTIYQSEYGKKMMILEQEGPPDALIIEKDEAKAAKKDELKLLKMKDLFDNRETEKVDKVALRKYELSKLQYYYAIAVCSSNELALKIYNELNDYEIELSSIKLDLRFVSSEIKLPEEFKEKCTEAPLQYTPKYDLFNRAVQHTDVKLTWESNEEQSKKISKVMNKFYKDEDIPEDDLKEILAVEGESEEEDNIVCDQCTAEKMCDDCKAKRHKNILDKANVFKDAFKPKEDSENEEDYFGNKSKRKKKKINVEFKNPLESNSYKKELELLVEEPKPQFKFNLHDERFESLYKDPNYSIDPTNQKSKTVNKSLIKEQMKRKRNRDNQ